MPPLPGAGAAGVHVFRDPEDCARMLDDAARCEHAAVIGGGLLGLEAAHALARLGVRTTVVHLMARLLERQLDDEAAALLAPAMQELGVDVLLERRTDAILADADGRVRAMRFADGLELQCDLVVIAVGIRPNTELARRAGLTVESAGLREQGRDGPVGFPLDVPLLVLEADPADASSVSELVAESLAERPSVALDRLPGLGWDRFSRAGEHPVFDVIGVHFLFGE